MSNQTTAVSLRDASMDALGQIGQNLQKYADFLRFQGRVFKHSPYIALAFYAQNPDTQFIASREQWEGLHYTVNSGAAAVRYTGGDGKTVDLYDFSDQGGNSALSLDGQPPECRSDQGGARRK